MSMYDTGGGFTHRYHSDVGIIAYKMAAVPIRTYNKNDTNNIVSSDSNSQSHATLLSPAFLKRWRELTNG